jgi:hypothetical protein
MTCSQRGSGQTVTTLVVSSDMDCGVKNVEKNVERNVDRNIERNVERNVDRKVEESKQNPRQVRKHVRHLNVYIFQFLLLSCDSSF